MFIQKRLDLDPSLSSRVWSLVIAIVYLMSIACVHYETLVKRFPSSKDSVDRDLTWSWGLRERGPK